LLAIVPQFVVAWNHHCGKLNGSEWFGVVQENLLTLGAIAQQPRQRLCAVRAIPIPADGYGPRWMHDEVVRTALRLNLPMPEQLRLYGDRQGHWITSGTEAGDILAIHPADQIAADGAPPHRPAVSAALLLARSGMPA
jgi:hypothetical protein